MDVIFCRKNWQQYIYVDRTNNLNWTENSFNSSEINKNVFKALIHNFTKNE